MERLCRWCTRTSWPNRMPAGIVDENHPRCCFLSLSPPLTHVEAFVAQVESDWSHLVIVRHLLRRWFHVSAACCPLPQR